MFMVIKSLFILVEPPDVTGMMVVPTSTLIAFVLNYMLLVICD